MRKFASATGWLTLGVVLALALLELVLRFLPVPMGLYRTQRYDEWPLQSYEPKLAYTYSKSWALRNAHRGMTNNYGHIAPFDFHKDSAPVIVLGDSFVEGLMNTYPETLQGRLGTLLGDPQSVYGLGVSGLSISDYLALSRLARDEFKPAAAVLLLSDGDISESVIDQTGHYWFSVRGDGVALNYRPLDNDSVFRTLRIRIGDISLYRYLQVNLGLSLPRLSVWPKRKAAAAASGVDERTDARLYPVVDYFLHNLPATLGLPPRCVVFLLDSDRYAIYKPEQASKRIDDPRLRGYFQREATAQGFRVADLDPIFREAYARDQVKFDYWPLDRHWNGAGHDVAATTAYRLLYGTPGESCRPGKRIATQ